MKRVYVNEDWCLGCHLCEFYCAFANSGEKDMSKAFKLGKDAAPRIRVEEGDGINFAVQCRHCQDPACVKGCIAGALTKNENGVIEINTDKCVGCYTCVLSCPYGCIVIDPKIREEQLPSASFAQETALASLPVRLTVPTGLSSLRKGEKNDEIRYYRKFRSGHRCGTGNKRSR